jgi:allantoate deiminase
MPDVIADALAREALERCEELARHTEEPGKITRTFLSAPMKAVHQLLDFWMRDAGMQTRIDAVGNVIGRLETEKPGAKTLLVGSHVDTVPNAGKFDGILGVVLGIALVKTLSRAGRKLPFALEVIAFSEEEGVRFSTPFLGSRAVAGTFDSRLLELTDAKGITVAQAIRDFGLEPGLIPQATHTARDILGYLEVHIEQGPVLESLGIPLGVVEGIAGQTRISLELRGQAAHAGTTPMHLRQDALAGAVAVIAEVERLARATPGLVATVGRIEVAPGAGNVIPESARFSLDVRHISDATRNRSVAELLDFAWHTAQRRKLEYTFQTTLEQPAAPCDELLSDFLADTLEDLKFRVHRLPSGAGHDAMVMSGLCPTAMLFVRSPRGISHHPDEAVLPGDVIAALRVMLEYVAKLERWQRAVNP